MWPNPQSPADFVTFTEKNHGKLHFLCTLSRWFWSNLKLFLEPGLTIPDLLPQAEPNWTKLSKFYLFISLIFIIAGTMQSYGKREHYWLKISSIMQYPRRVTAQKMKFSTKDFFSKCGQIRIFSRIWSHLLGKSLMENFIFLCSWYKFKGGLIWVVQCLHVLFWFFLFYLFLLPFFKQILKNLVLFSAISSHSFKTAIRTNIRLFLCIVS